MTKNKMSFKNDKVGRVLLSHFLNDENHTQILGRENLFDRMC